MVKITFDSSARGFILDALGKTVDSDGYIVDKKCKGHRVLTIAGDEIPAEEFAGVRKGSTVFIKSDITSLVQAVQAMS